MCVRQPAGAAEEVRESRALQAPEPLAQVQALAREVGAVSQPLVAEPRVPGVWLPQQPLPAGSKSYPPGKSNED